MKPPRADRKMDEVLKRAQGAIEQSKRLIAVAEKALADNKLFIAKFKREVAAIRKTLRKFKSN